VTAPDNSDAERSSDDEGAEDESMFENPDSGGTGAADQDDRHGTTFTIIIE